MLRTGRRCSGDRWLTCLCLGVGLFGLLLVYSATRYDPSLHSLAGKQGIAWIMGVGIFFLLERLPVEAIAQRCWWALPVWNIGLLLLLLPFGQDGGTGNRSWIFLPGGLLSFQPGEIGKLGYVLLLAIQIRYLQKRGAGRLKQVIGTGGHALLMGGLLYGTSKDLGMILIYLVIYFGTAWGAGLNAPLLLLCLAGGIGGGVLLWPYLPEYVQMRFLVVADHSLDPFGKGFQQERSVLALGSGKVTGQGLLQGTQTQSSSPAALPARHTDFIFSVAGEELGLVGCLLILAGLGAIVLRCFWLAHRCKGISRSIAMGFGTMIAGQTILNVGMCLYAVPVVGLTLPFLSYGGTALVTSYAAMGMLSGVFRRQIRP